MELLIYYKDNVRDPEGETIYRYMIRKISNNVTEVRAGKYLRFKVNAKSREEARDIVKKLSEKLMLYNPLVHRAEVRVYDSDN